MEKYNKELGRFGEDKATEFLKNKGYRIIDRNYNCRFGELDIVGMDNKCLTFVEVKTRTSDKYGTPSNAINYYKQKHLTLSARNYIDYKRLGEYFARFDVVEVFVDYADNTFVLKEIKLIQNAFQC